MKKQLDPAHAHFEPVVNHWPKVSGELPAPELFNAVFALGLRPGGKHTLACAMYMRTDGATDSEVIAAARLLNAPHKRNQRQDVLHNYAFDGKTGLCGLVGLCRRDMNIAKRDGAKVYKMTLTAKGEKQVARWQAAQAAAPVADTSKAKKAKAKKAKAERAQTKASVQAHRPKAHQVPVTTETAPVISDNSVLIPAQSTEQTNS